MHRDPLYVRCAIDRCDGEATSGCRRCEKALCEAHVPNHECPADEGTRDTRKGGGLTGLSGCIPDGVLGIAVALLLVLVVGVVRVAIALMRRPPAGK